MLDSSFPRLPQTLFMIQFGVCRLFSAEDPLVLADDNASVR